MPEIPEINLWVYSWDTTCFVPYLASINTSTQFKMVRISAYSFLKLPYSLPLVPTNFYSVLFQIHIQVIWYGIRTLITYLVLSATSAWKDFVEALINSCPCWSFTSAISEYAVITCTQTITRIRREQSTKFDMVRQTNPHNLVYCSKSVTIFAK